MVTEIPFFEERKRLKNLTFFLVLLVLLMEVLVLYQVSTVPMFWNSMMSDAIPCILIMSSSAVALGAMLCELNEKRNVVNVVTTLFWAVYSVYHVQKALQHPLEVSSTHAVVHTLVASFLGGLSALTYVHREGIGALARNVQRFAFIAKRIFPIYLFMVAFADVLFYCIFFRLAVG